MNGKRSRWLPAGMLITSLACLVAGAAALGGLAGAPGGDLPVSSGPGTANLALALGVALLLGLEYARAMSRRPSRLDRPMPAHEAIEPRRRLDAR